MVEQIDMLVQSGNVGIRLMRDDEADYRLMARWLSDERVLEFYEGRDKPFDVEKVVEKYSPRVLGKDKTIPCIIEVIETFEKKIVHHGCVKQTL